LRRHQTTEPMRRCIGCMQSKPQRELMRFTAVGTEITADCGTKNEGRGFYLCRNEECIEKAFKKKAFNRICKSKIDIEEVRKIIGAVSGIN